MPHTIENFTQVKLILKDNPKDDGHWRICWDLSDNGYAMDELLESGETVPLSTGLLRNMIVKAQKGRPRIPEHSLRRMFARQRGGTKKAGVRVRGNPEPRPLRGFSGLLFGSRAEFGSVVPGFRGLSRIG